MSYILESLGERERLLATAHIAWAYKVAAGLVLLAGVLLALGYMRLGWSPEWSPSRSWP